MSQCITELITGIHKGLLPLWFTRGKYRIPIHVPGLVFIIFTGPASALEEVIPGLPDQSSNYVIITGAVAILLLLAALVVLVFGWARTLRRQIEIKTAELKAENEQGLERLLELRKSEERFREIFNNSNDAIYLVSSSGIGAPGRFIEVNRKAVAMLGYSEDEFRGMTPWDIHDPATLDDVRNIPEMLAGTGHVVLRTNHRAKEGRIIPVELSIHEFTLGSEHVDLVIARDITDRKRAEDALKRSERRLTDIISFLPDATFVIDRDGTVIAWNKAMEEMTGVPAGQMLGKGDHEYAIPFYGHRRPILVDMIFEPDDQIRKTYNSIREDGDVLVAELDLPIPLGKISTLWGKAGPLYDESGTMIGAIESIRDITDRKIAEEALKKSDEQLRLKLDSVLSPDVSIGEEELANIIDSQAIQSMMEDFTRLTGMATAIVDLNGKIIESAGWQDICTKFHRVNAESARYCRESDLYLTGKMKPGEFVTYKCRNNIRDIVTPLYIGDKQIGNLFTGQFFYDDETVDEDIFIAQAEKFGFDRDAYLSALHRIPRFSREKVDYLMKYLVKFTEFISKLSYSNIKLARLISDYKRAEIALKQSEDKYRTLFENSGSPLMIVAEDTTILLVNREFEAISGYSREEVEGIKSWTEFVADAEDLAKMKEYNRLRRISPDLVPVSYESRITRRFGDFRDVIISVAMIPGTTQSLAVLVDITERRRAEEELRKLYSELERRVTERTADLKQAQEAFRQANAKLNLLNSITRHDINNQLTGLEGYLVVLSEKFADPGAAEILRKAQMAGRAIHRQIAFTKDYQDIGVKSPRWQNVNTIIRRVVEELPHDHTAIGSRFAGLEIYADPLFTKVVYNLVDNAIRYGETITKIEFSYRDTPEGIALICEDDGVGISGEDTTHLFEKGFGKHTGLGLFLSREILGITGLSIHETGGPGKGARFEILVPKGAFRFTDTPDQPVAMKDRGEVPPDRTGSPAG